VGECLDIDIYQSSSGKLYINPATIHPCQNIENTSTERPQVIKPPTNNLASNVEIPMKFEFEIWKYEKKKVT
jgi:hypothetical protein